MPLDLYKYYIGFRKGLACLSVFIHMSFMSYGKYKIYILKVSTPTKRSSSIFLCICNNSLNGIEYWLNSRTDRPKAKEENAVEQCTQFIVSILLEGALYMPISHIYYMHIHRCIYHILILIMASKIFFFRQYHETCHSVKFHLISNILYLILYTKYSR